MIERTYPTRRSKRARIAEKSNHLCWYCGSTLNESTRTHDHVIPRSEDGPSNEQNLVLSCVRCNNQKRNLSLEDYRRECGGVKFYGESIRRESDTERKKCTCAPEAPDCDDPETSRKQLPADGRRPKYVNDPRRVAPPSGRGQHPK